MTESSHPSGRHGFATRAVHGVSLPLPAERPLATPIYQASTFGFEDADQYTEALNRPESGFAYTRYANPTTAQLEATVADLEGGSSALAAASGMGIISPVLIELLRGGGHAVVQRSLYGGTYALLTDLAPDLGIETTFVDTTNLDAVREAIRPDTRLLYAETISNPTMEVADLPALGALAADRGIDLVVDNTIATPYLARPLDHGASVVVHSATKYLGGHSDVIAGIGVFKDAGTRHRVWKAMIDLGASIDPFAAWLVLRGIRTLPLRMRAHTENAGALACWLQEQPQVERVYWPGLPAHPSHEVAGRVLDGYSGMLSFDLKGGREAGKRFVEGTRLAAMAASLGGIDTLVSHPASTTHRQLTPEALADAGIGPGMIRVSVGLESPEDIIADFAGALEAA